MKYKLTENTKVVDGVTSASCEYLSYTLSLCEYRDPKNGKFGFWIYDEVQGINLAMRAKTSTDAFVGAIMFYQQRLAIVERDYDRLLNKVEVFVSQFAEESK